MTTIITAIIGRALYADGPAARIGCDIEIIASQGVTDHVYDIVAASLARAS